MHLANQGIPCLLIEPKGSLLCSQQPVKFAALGNNISQQTGLYSKKLLAPNQAPSCRTISCYLSMTVYSVCSQLTTVCGGLLHQQPGDVPCCGDKGPIVHGSGRFPWSVTSICTLLSLYLVPIYLMIGATDAEHKTSFTIFIQMLNSVYHLGVCSLSVCDVIQETDKLIPHVLVKEAKAGPGGDTMCCEETAHYRRALTRTQTAGPSHVRWMCIGTGCCYPHHCVFVSLG